MGQNENGAAAMATQIRRDVIRMISSVGSGHPGGALGAADILAALYSGGMRVKDANGKGRDRLVLSNGHICAAWYSALSLSGCIDRTELNGFRRLGSRLQGHPSRKHMKEWVETSTGPLGQGASVAHGIALGLRMNGSDAKVFTLVGDGEMQEGIVWEALMTAPQYKLGNVVLFVLWNGLQIDGTVENIKNLEPIADRLRAFGWDTIEIDGHDQKAIKSVLDRPRNATGKPTAVVARTIMSKGVSFMENDRKWHGTCPNKEQAEKALSELGAAGSFTDYPAVGGSK
ncbi:MAG: transketolase [Treponemataceae bacterium]